MRREGGKGKGGEREGWMEKDGEGRKVHERERERQINGVKSGLSTTLA